MLGDFKDESVLSSLDLKCVENEREFSIEVHIDDGTDNLRDLSD
jgi:hypothetical protein